MKKLAIAAVLVAVAVVGCGKKPSAPVSEERAALKNVYTTIISCDDDGENNFIQISAYEDLDTLDDAIKNGKNFSTSTGRLTSLVTSATETGVITFDNVTLNYDGTTKLFNIVFPAPVTGNINIVQKTATTWEAQVPASVDLPATTHPVACTVLPSQVPAPLKDRLAAAKKK
jgi:hypothetical protein